MKGLKRKIYYISIVLAIFCIKSSTSSPSLLRRISTEVDESEVKDDDAQISNYIYNKFRNYSERRMYTYCNTSGLPSHENMMIKQWTSFWEKEGWDPIILTIDEAKNHKDYSKYESLLNNLKFSSNQQQGYYRYLAMASTPGAEWFAEIHTLPLRPLLSESGENPGLPNGGRFTVYDRQFPSLMSGSQEEWNSISQKLLKEPKATDLEALRHLFSIDSNAFASEQSVMHEKYVIGEEQFDNDICVNTQDKRAFRLPANEFQGTGLSIHEWTKISESFMKVWNGKCRSSRPVIFTYFEIIKSKSTSRSASVLEAWKKAWSDIGWEPVVLNLGDVMRHPRHRDIINVFENSSGEYSMSIYDRMCFYRWFAMAASGGGWMADIDAFPLHMQPSKYGKEIPYKGLLTGYARHIPCLVSGSGPEWNRLAWILVDSYKIHADEFWSDMLALQEVHEILDVFQYKRESVEFHHLFDKDEKLSDPYQMKAGSKDRCLLTDDKKVIHFSHWSVLQGVEGVGFSNEDYGSQENIAVKWIRSWKEQCQTDDMNSAQAFNLKSTQEKEIYSSELSQRFTQIRSGQNNSAQKIEIKSSELPYSVTQTRPMQDANVQSAQNAQSVNQVRSSQNFNPQPKQKKEIDPHGDKEDKFIIEW